MKRAAVALAALAALSFPFWASEFWVSTVVCRMLILSASTPRITLRLKPVLISTTCTGWPSLMKPSVFSCRACWR